MKRLAVFLVLLIAGFYVLYELVGEDMIVTAGGPERDEPKRQSPRSNSGVGISQGGSFGATAEQRGELLFPQVKEVLQPDGTIIKETVFQLHAADSQPLRDGLQQLDDVTVDLFQNGAPTAVLRAAQALVELGRDANGNPSLAANKEIAMTEVVFEALPGSKLAGLRLELDRARALIDDNELNIYTPAPTDPVRITFAGERSATLVGKGLQAQLPRDRSGALKRVTIEILSDPVLTTTGAVARASGRLFYAEDTARGVAELSLSESVELVLDKRIQVGASAESGGDPDPEALRVNGDQMLGWLVRGSFRDADGQIREQMSWRMLQLHGAPARVELPDFHLSTPQLTVLPGLYGSPFWMTASGGVSRIDQVSAPTARGMTQIHGTSQRRIHVLHGREHLGANHRAFGFPQWSLGPLDDFHVVSFEGKSHLEDASRSIDASAGLHVFQTDSNQRGVIARGFGDVTMQQAATAKLKPLRAGGNDGFSLVATDEREELDLGPSATRDNGVPWRNHRYEIEHGDLRATGAGSCRLEREGDYAVVTMRAPDREIAATIAGRGADLTNLRWLRAEFDGRDVRTFDLVGVPAQATLQRAGETLVATAPRIEQTSSASLRMLPPDPGASPELWHGLRVEDRMPRLRREAPPVGGRGRQSLVANAPRIDLHYLGRGQVLVDAQSAGGVPARADATIERRPGEPPVLVALEADRLQALPFALPPAVLRSHLGGYDAGAGGLGFFAERGPWILGDGVYSVRVEDPDPTAGSFRGQAKRLVMSAAAEACLLMGDPDQMQPASATRITKEREVTTRGAQVRIFRDEAVRLQAFRAFPGRSLFLLPEVELHQNDRGDVLSHVIAACRGDIDVLQDAVLFRGPVVARSVTADGSTLPGGLGIVAESLKMELHPETGDVLRVLGRNVDLDWSQVSGHAADIELDLRWSRLVAQDPDGVSVTLASGIVITGKQVTVDYRTLAFDIYRGRIDR